ncbi:MAG TPA: NmrA family NAD(P)-binding protein [Anaerolineales bacterium]|nr:NmrA family NAD(P)-binding protein [Anaerolineales bacterium]
MILVTGASGKTGRAVVAALAKKGEAVRAIIRRPSQTETLTQLGASEVLVGDMRLPDDMRRAAARARAVYHICPNVHPDEVEIGRTVISSAREAGVKRFALHSVLHPQAEPMPHHWNKLRVEETLLESGLEFTILQPTAYMQNLLPGWTSIVHEGVLRNPYPVETRLSLVDLEDVAEAAAKVLTEAGHSGATYELVGTPPLSQAEVAAILTEALGRLVRAEAEPVEAWQARARAAGMGESQRETLTQMFHHYERFGLPGNPNVLRWLLGREPTGLADFARRAVAADG